jgi:predicted nucleotide-binding protein
MSNAPLNENDRRILTNSQLMQLVFQYGTVLSNDEQARLTNSQLLELAKAGQTLTERSRSNLTASQRLELHQIVQANMTTSPNGISKTNRVFIAYGRNLKARSAMFAFLRSVGLNPLEWEELVQATGNPNPYILDVIDKGFQVAQAALILLTPDDQAQLQQHLWRATEDEYETRLMPQPRPNVLIEAGMALGRDPSRVVVVQLGQLRPISDLFGKHIVLLDNTSRKRQDVVDRLRLAGCQPSIEGRRDWHTEGDFDGAIA